MKGTKTNIFNRRWPILIKLFFAWPTGNSLIISFWVVFTRNSKILSNTEINILKSINKWLFFHWPTTKNCSTLCSAHNIIWTTFDAKMINDNLEILSNWFLPKCRKISWKSSQMFIGFSSFFFGAERVMAKWIAGKINYTSWHEKTWKSNPQIILEFEKKSMKLAKDKSF